MLKKRIIATVIVRNGIVVQSIGFNKYLPVGKPEIAIEYFSSWGADEIVLIDISATQEKRGPDYNMVKRVAKHSIVPLTVGGGITSVDAIYKLLHSGADKVVVNNLLSQFPETITKAAQYFGNQCIVASIDYISTKNLTTVFNYLQKQPSSYKNVKDYALYCESIGAGEIFLTSVERDGKYCGYDIATIDMVSKAVKIPVIASGGAGKGEHFVEVFSETNAAAAAAANYFHFTEHAIILAKSQIQQLSPLPIRLETAATYHSNSISMEQRLLKKEDEVLEDLLFVKIEKEII